MKKLKIALLYGGKSAEHEVSLRSAENVASAIDKDKYEIEKILIRKDGTWEKEMYQIDADVFFPLLHGPFGEDGTVQGLLKLANVPFVGASVLGSAIGMDKDVMNRLLRDAGIPTKKFLSFKEKDIDFDYVERELGSPFFVKPANAGSSVGVSKVKAKADFDKAVKQAFMFDRKIIIEEYIQGREIECSVLGNEKPTASVLGEIVPHDEFYSYNAKYVDQDGAELIIPAKIDSEVAKEIQRIAVQVFLALECEGLGRVDFFLTKNNKIVVNEINTIPGFTNISMYPKLWEASGLGYADLIDRLIQLAVARFEKESKLITSYISG